MGAWPPVYRDIYRRYSNYCFGPIDSVDEFDVSSLSGEEKLLIDSIVRHVCCYSGKTLESFTHTETPVVILPDTCRRFNLHGINYL